MNFFKRLRKGERDTKAGESTSAFRLWGKGSNKDKVSPMLFREAVFSYYFERLTTIKDNPQYVDYFVRLDGKLASLNSRDLLLLAYRFYMSSFALIQYLSSFSSSTHVTIPADFNLRVIYDLSSRVQYIPLGVMEDGKVDLRKLLLDLVELLLSLKDMSDVLLEMDSRYQDLLDTIDNMLTILDVPILQH